MRQRQLAGAFVSWALLARKLHLAVRLLSGILARLQRCCFLAWRHAAARNHGARSHAFQLWRAWYAMRAAWTAPLTLQDAAVACAHERDALCRRVLHALQAHTSRRQVKRTARRMGAHALLRKAFAYWVSALAKAVEGRRNVHAATRLHSARLRCLVLQAWRTEWTRIQLMRAAAQELTVAVRARVARSVSSAWTRSGFHGRQLDRVRRSCASRLAHTVRGASELTCCRRCSCCHQHGTSSTHVSRLERLVLVLVPCTHKLNWWQVTSRLT